MIGAFQHPAEGNQEFTSNGSMASTVVAEQRESMRDLESAVWEVDPQSLENQKRTPLDRRHPQLTGKINSSASLLL